jgi:CO/xanthine dehydrogenase FAD-binding subunit
LALPEVLLDIEGVRELDYIKYDMTDGLSIGAATPVSAMEKSPVIREKFPVLAQAAGTLGSPVIRSRATIGGNLCNAAPSADTAPALIALDARVKIASTDGEKVVPLGEFFTAPGETLLEAGQILVEIRVPDMPRRSGAAYIKQQRRRGADLAVVGVAVMAVLEEGGHLEDIRIVLGAVAPAPIRAGEAEKILRGREISAMLLEKAGQAAASESRPIDDGRSSADYRKKLVAVLVPRAVKQAVGQINLEV